MTRAETSSVTPSKPNRRALTPEEVAFIGENYRTMSDRELAAELGRPVGAIQMARTGNGWRREISVEDYRPKVPAPTRPKGFTKADIRWAIANIGTPEARLIAAQIVKPDGIGKGIARRRSKSAAGASA